MRKTKKQMFVVIGVFALVMMLGTVTYAFFNYTRTGTANTIRTGRIAFESSQGTAINLTNVFPVEVTNGIPSNSNVGSVTINVTGDTAYGEGIEYLVSAVNVTNTVGSGQNVKSLPISIDVAVQSNTENTPATTLGTASDDYFTNRGSTTSYYKVLASDVVENNEQLLVGYIAPGATGVDGNIVIRAYLDASKVAISDTYDESNPGTDNMGTTSTWVGDRTVFTTTEWNSLQTNGVSFQVRVETNEGTWVEEPVIPGTIPSCPGCKFIFTTGTYYYSGANTSTLTSFENNNETLVDDYRTLDRDRFLGFKFDGSGNVTNAYACGIKGEAPNEGKAFCIEGTTNGSVFDTIQAFLNDGTTGLWLGNCTTGDFNILCWGSTHVYAYDTGFVDVGDDGVSCFVKSTGAASCGYWD